MDTKDFDVVAMRTDLHQIPELGFNEHKTSDYVAAKLKEMGLEPIRGIGGTGVVAYIDGTEPGPTVMLRADMDALPFVIDGKDACIHACGHDSHTAMVLATAAKLIGHVKKGRVKLLTTASWMTSTTLSVLMFVRSRTFLTALSALLFVILPAHSASSNSRAKSRTALARTSEPALLKQPFSQPMP